WPNSPRSHAPGPLAGGGRGPLRPAARAPRWDRKLAPHLNPALSVARQWRITRRGAAGGNRGGRGASSGAGWVGGRRRCPPGNADESIDLRRTLFNESDFGLSIKAHLWRWLHARTDTLRRNAPRSVTSDFRLRSRFTRD